MDRLLSMRVFERVVAEGGFAAAARALDLSPPVVTRLVADLEEHLGARLLQRTTRRLSLTEAGQHYLGRVRNILQDIEEADAVARAHTLELSGLLRVHAPPVLASYVVAPLLAGFRQRYPKIQVDIDVETMAIFDSLPGFLCFLKNRAGEHLFGLGGIGGQAGMGFRQAPALHIAAQQIATVQPVINATTGKSLSINVVRGANARDKPAGSSVDRRAKLAVSMVASGQVAAQCKAHSTRATSAR